MTTSYSLVNGHLREIPILSLFSGSTYSKLKLKLYTVEYKRLEPFSELFQNLNTTVKHFS